MDFMNTFDLFNELFILYLFTSLSTSFITMNKQNLNNTSEYYELSAPF